MHTVSTRSVWSAYRELAKSGIVFLVLISVLAGYLLGQPFEHPLNLWHLTATLVGIMLLASGSSALNQIQEREVDARMPRTERRPLPSGRIQLKEAMAFTSGSLALGLAILGILSVDLLILGVIAVLSYNGLYTLWWKRKMAFAAVPGAVPGAMPILMGYAAAHGDWRAPGGIYLFALLFFWQMPHFWALAIRYREDYRKGSFPTLPVAHGTQVTVFQTTLWCLSYVAIALGAPIFFKAGALYLGATILLSAKLLWELRRFHLAPETGGWLRFFLWVNFSLIGFLSALVADQWAIHLIPLIKG